MRAFLDGLTTFEYVMIVVVIVTSVASSVVKSFRTYQKIRMLRKQTQILEEENRRIANSPDRRKEAR